MSGDIHEKLRENIQCFVFLNPLTDKNAFLFQNNTLDALISRYILSNHDRNKRITLTIAAYIL